MDYLKRFLLVGWTVWVISGCQSPSGSMCAVRVDEAEWKPAATTADVSNIHRDDSVVPAVATESDVAAREPNPTGAKLDLHDAQTEDLETAPREVGTSPPLTLDEVIAWVLESTPDLQAAQERLRVADAALARARADFFPTLAITGDYGVTNNPVQVFSFLLNQGQLSFDQNFNQPPTVDNFHARVRLAQEVFSGGRRLAQEQSAAWQLEAAGADLDAIRNQVIYRAAEAFYRLLQAKELVKVRTEAVDQVTRHLEIVRSRFRAGTAVQSDVLSVEVRLAEAEEALITSRHQLELAWAVLENVIGRPVDRRPLPDQVVEAPWSKHVDDVRQAIANALARRPELNQLGSQYQSAMAQVDAARAGKRPRVSLVTDYDVFTGDFRRGNDSFFVGLVAELTLFDSGRTRAEVARAAARARELAARYRRLASDIELDVRRAYLQLLDAQARLKVAEKATVQAAESLREIEVRYRGQTVPLTRLIDAQVALSNARVRRANAEADVEIARASLERAVGRLGDLALP